MARAGADRAPDWTYVSEAWEPTGTDGRWHFDEMPSGWAYVYLRVSHPDHVPSSMQHDFPQPSDFLLKARRAEITLDDGVALEGRVVDDQGRPLANARVGLGADRRVGQRFFPDTATNAEGRFRFPHLPAGTLTVTAQARGQSPELV